jgi:hypothetical protein
VKPKHTLAVLDVVFPVPGIGVATARPQKGAIALLLAIHPFAYSSAKDILKR